MRILLDAFFASDWIGRLVVVILLASSILTWAVVFYKYSRLNASKRLNKVLIRLYNSKLHPAMLFLEAKDGQSLNKDATMTEIYTATMRELMTFLRRTGMPDSTIKTWQQGTFGPILPENAVATIRAAAEGNLSLQILRLEKLMNIIAIAVSAAPSLGLFGTVWGIMGAFMGMVNGSSAIVLANVAPGIAAALLTTVVGLLVSIPSSIVYNLLADNIREQTVELENFTDRLLADIARMHGATGASTPSQTAAAPIVLQSAPAFVQPQAAYIQPAPMPQYTQTAPQYQQSAPAEPMVPPGFSDRSF